MNAMVRNSSSHIETNQARIHQREHKTYLVDRKGSTLFHVVIPPQVLEFLSGLNQSELVDLITAVQREPNSHASEENSHRESDTSSTSISGTHPRVEEGK